MPARVALKIDVDTLRGTLEGVPALMRMLERLGVNATFLFSLGPDHTGRALKRIFRPGFLSKVKRTSVVTHYGWRTLCYGTVLPGPDIGVRARQVMRDVRDAGFEVGVHCYDHVLWQDYVRERDYLWTHRQMMLAVNAFERVFGELPTVHGAAGWQVNTHVPEIESRMGFQYASDTRGTQPFLPLLDGRVGQCPQLPTTLPTFDELLGVGTCTEANVDDIVFQRSLAPAPAAHVFTLHAELEGMRLAAAFERLARRWLSHLINPCTLREAYLRHEGPLPAHAIRFDAVDGRSGTLACQAPAVSAA